MRREFTLNRIKDLGWVLALMAAVVAVARFTYGLGAVTDLSDALPWGLWQTLNLAAGAALAAGGSIVAVAVYVFRIERWRSLLRVAVVTAFLGYGASLSDLLSDLGRPWRLWSVLLHGNPRSFLFLVLFCLFGCGLIAGTQTLPLVFERLPWPRFTRFLLRTMVPLAILGATLSLLTHSGLGSLFTVFPTRLHPLWYSTWLPLEFLLSAAGGGLALVIFAALAYAWLYGKEPDRPALQSLAGACAVTLAVFFAVRGMDFTVHQKWGWVWGKDRGEESLVLLAETLLQVVIPAVIMGLPAGRRSKKGLAAAAALAILGLAMHRADTGIVGFFRSAGTAYFPTAAEIVIGLGIVAAAGLVFFFLVEHFHVFGPPPVHLAPEAGLAPPESVPPWTWKEIRGMFISFAAFRIAIILVLAPPLSFWLFQDNFFHAFEAKTQPALPPTGEDSARTLLKIDANRKDGAVNFPHLAHQQLMGGESSCTICHHLALPRDHSTACWRCHRDMTLPSTLYFPLRHRNIFIRLGTSTDPREPDRLKTLVARACQDCHPSERPDSEQMNYHLESAGKMAELAEYKGPGLARACYRCHLQDMPGMAAYQNQPINFMVPAYLDAMHGRCLVCHRKSAKETANPELGNCKTCHPLQTNPSADQINK